MEFNALQHPLFPQALRRLFGLVAAPGATTLASEFQITVPILDPKQAEFLALLGGSPFMGTATAAAGAAGVFSACGVRNPALSNIIVVVTGFRTNAANAAALVLQRLSDTAAAIQVSASSAFGTDSRAPRFFGGGAPVLITTHQSNNFGGAGFVGATAQINEQYAQYHLPIVLAPGSEMAVRHSTAATAITVDFVGYFRIGIPSELVLG